MGKITGSQAVVRCLQEEGVKIIFGYPGGAVIDLYDALMDADIENVLVRHEQGAVHAADGLARVTGQVGVALLTSGPGATNGVTGIATAYMDSIPLVVLTGQVPQATYRQRCLSGSGYCRYYQTLHKTQLSGE